MDMQMEVQEPQEALDRIAAASTREAQLEQLLAEAERELQTLRAARRTAPAGTPAFVSREGVAVQAGALDAALRSLSIEQRIAVKSELFRAGYFVPSSASL